MLKDILKKVDYVRTSENTWSSIYDVLLTGNLLNKPIEILLLYHNDLESETVVGISPVTMNTRIAYVLEGYTCKPNITLTDENGDNFDDKDQLSFLPDNHHNNLMVCLKSVNMIDKPINLFYKLSENTTQMISISYIDFDDNLNDYGLLTGFQNHMLTCSKSNTKSFVYVIVNNSVPAELQRYLVLNPTAIFIRTL